MKSCTKKQLAELYGISRPTLNKWLKVAEIPIIKGSNIFNPAQIKEIFEKLGLPDSLED